MILWNLFEITANAFQAWLFVFFMNSKIHPKEGKAVYEWTCIASITFFFSLFLIPGFYPAEILVWLFPFFYGVKTSDEHVLVRFLDDHAGNALHKHGQSVYARLSESGKLSL